MVKNVNADQSATSVDKFRNIRTVWMNEKKNYFYNNYNRKINRFVEPIEFIATDDGTTNLRTTLQCGVNAARTVGNR